MALYVLKDLENPLILVQLIQELLKAGWSPPSLYFCDFPVKQLFAVIKTHQQQIKKQSVDMCQTCSVWCDGVQFDSQRVAGLSVMLQGMTVAPAAIEEPLPTEHCSVCQVQPQVLPHLTLLTLPAADGTEKEIHYWCVWLTEKQTYKKEFFIFLKKNYNPARTAVINQRCQI